MLSGRRKKDYEAESSAQALQAQAQANGFTPEVDATEPIPEEAAAA